MLRVLKLRGMDGMQNDLSQKIDNIQYSISKLTNLNTVNEKGKFPSQPSQNPKVFMKLNPRWESSKLRESKLVITIENIEEEPRIAIKKDMMKKHMPPPFPQALHGKKGIKNSTEILEDLCTVKRGLNVTRKAFLTEQVSAIIQSKSPVKYKIWDVPPFQSTLEGHMWRSFTRLGGKCEFAPILCEWGDAAHIWKHDLGIKHIPPMQEASSPEEEEGLEEVCLINTLVEEHCDKNLEESLNESLGRGLTRSSWEDPPKLVLKPLPVDLKKCKKAIGWQISDLKGISPLVCTHHILHGGRCKTSEAAPEELVGEPTQVVPKKSGITVIQNEKGEEVSTRPTSGWRVCIDYRRLNSVTRKDHFPLPFMDQVLERVSGHPFYCFWMVTRGECPLVYVMLLQLSKDCSPRCIEKDLVLNWEKCHFMVQQGIVLGHIISKNGIEVDKAKVELIVKLPPPTNVKGIRQFLGHAGFYRRFIKDFSKISKPLCELLVKDAKFVWDEKLLANQARCQGKIDKMDPFAQEFNLQIRDKKGVENVVADHLSRLVIAHDSHGLPINDDFPEESLMSIEVAPWYSHIANYLVTGEVPSEWSAQDKRHFFAKIHAYYWEEPFLFKYCADQIIRKCVPEQEQSGILPIA
ncbi:Retrovirus-related Pol polyprotein from transposon opus [Vitis vinifera]|uniref:Retrovirus-related Pol polyprotein from transposon opus n=1 Tax=Vitis vinifera TaxID=29760 RepID=A0A438CEB1_VITVI|nr:Retrovirus-related Pol polyprotein from transposon opus [Vitis vinifera]